MSDHDPIKAAELEARLAALNVYMKALGKTGPELQAVKAESLAAIAKVKNSPRSEAEKIAWANAYTTEFTNLTSGIAPEIPRDKAWTYVDVEGQQQQSYLAGLTQLAAVGEITAESHVLPPGGTAWVAATSVPEIRTGIEEYRVAMTWKARVKGQEFECFGVSTLAQWVQQGRVLRDTEIFNPHDKVWRPAVEEPKLQGVKWKAAGGCLTVFLFWMR
jgi:hypothetical protein